MKFFSVKGDLVEATWEGILKAFFSNMKNDLVFEFQQQHKMS